MTISYTLLTTRTKQWVNRSNKLFGKQFLHLGEYLVIKIEKTIENISDKYFTAFVDNGFLQLWSP